MDDRSRPSVPLLYRLVRDRTGQSETLGVVLLLGIAVVGTAAIVAFGSTALSETKQASQLQRTEHTFTLFDSRSAMVALGESNMQQVDMAGSGDGDYTVKEGTGSIKVIHRNYSTNGGTEVIYDAPLGELVYENGDTKIAYQGGGVWRKEGNYTAMVSPPEFHYRSSTLTLPVIQVTGDGSASGSVTATVKSIGEPRRVFPNTSYASNIAPNEGAPYDNMDGDDTTTGPTKPYLNPVKNGTVWIKVQSAYYQGWAEFFRTRSGGDVKVWHSNDTAAMQLIGAGKVGDFNMPADGNNINVQGVGEGHPITNMTILLTDDGGDSANFANLQWSMYAESGNLQWEVHLRDGKKACKGSQDTEYADVTVYFSDNAGATYQGWAAENAVPIECTDFDGDDDKENVLRLNLTSEKIDLEYQSLSNSDTNYFSPNDFEENANWSIHSDSVPWEDPGFEIDTSTTTTINNTTNHYLSQFGNNYDITVADKSSNTVSESASRGTMNYDGSGQIFITFLHITENEVRVEF